MTDSTEGTHLSNLSPPGISEASQNFHVSLLQTAWPQELTNDFTGTKAERNNQTFAVGEESAFKMSIIASKRTQYTLLTWRIPTASIALGLLLPLSKDIPEGICFGDLTGPSEVAREVKRG